MTKRILILFLSLGMILNTSACTSGGSSGDGDTAESNDESFSDESEGDFSDELAEETSDLGGKEEKVADDVSDEVEAGESEGGGETTKTADASEKAEDELSLDDAGEEPSELPEEVASTEDPAAAAPPATEEPAPAIEEPAPVAEAAPAPTDEPLFKQEQPVAEAAPEPAISHESAPAPAPADAEPRAFLPVVKIKDSAFDQGGTNLNRVYIARPDDDFKSISKKIYGSNRSKDLKTWNPYVAGRGVKTGDKVYYSSPNNPTDMKMLTFYEDVGAPPQMYVTKEGDNIRTVSKDLLGSTDSWKEVWATNMTVESKGDVPGGVELRYWPDGAEQTVAQNTPPPPPMDQPAPPPMDSTLPPKDLPPPTDMAGAGAPPPAGGTPIDMASAATPTATPAADPMAPPQVAGTDPMAPPPVGGTDPMAPPPPPPTDVAAAGGMGSEMAPPPPPPPMEEPKPIEKKEAPPEMEQPQDPDTMMAMGFGGILLIAAAFLYVVIRKNRAKRVDMTQTQI